jgi:hypothetical protein
MNFALIEASDIDVEGLSVRFVQNRPLGSIPIVAWLCKSASTRDYYPPPCGPGLARPGQANQVVANLAQAQVSVKPLRAVERQA